MISMSLSWFLMEIENLLSIVLLCALWRNDDSSLGVVMEEGRDGGKLLGGEYKYIIIHTIF